LNEICVAPDVCTCIPGYTGADCSEPMCVQDCMNGGECVAPDTCQCAYGWFDVNCTTPVCSQTCGNGGNCTAPDKCECPNIWTGNDCRIPICEQECLNGGECVAPNTCQCPPQWTGFDCSIPVCHQGFFKAIDSTVSNYIEKYPLDRGRNPYPNLEVQLPPVWAMYRPCFFSSWCNTTNGFDCRQAEQTYRAIEPPSGPMYRNVTGRMTRPARCMTMELGEDVFTNFQYFRHDDSTSAYARYSPKQPYEPWGGYRSQQARAAVNESYTMNPFEEDRHAWSAFAGPTDGQTLPWYYAYDRHVAALEWHEVTQGYYVCANEGKCVAPDTCQCAPGWMGFDCRTPVCTQGYHVASQERYVTGTQAHDEVENFERYFIEDRLGPDHAEYRTAEEMALASRFTTERQDWEYSNPSYLTNWELFVNRTHRASELRHHGDERYLSKFGYRVWNNQLGSYGEDQLHGLAVDPLGGVVLAGTTDAIIGDDRQVVPNVDVWMARYDEFGDLDWIWQNGTTETESLAGIAIDRDRRLYAAGVTLGRLGDESYGVEDIWLSRWRASGLEQWTLQFGTQGADFVNDIAVDSEGNVYLAGATGGNIAGGQTFGGLDVWVAKYTSSGARAWISQFGTNEEDIAKAIAVDPFDNVFVGGTTSGQFCEACNHTGGLDGWVTKLDSDGVEQWTRQFGTSFADTVEDLDVDKNGAVVIGGSTVGALAAENIGAEDVYFIKFSADGRKEWQEQFGTEPSETVTAIAIDSKGAVFVAGVTTGSIMRANQGRLAEFTDTWYAKYSPHGERQFIDQFGTTENDVITRLAVSPSRGEPLIDDQMIVGGYSSGRYGPAVFGKSDAFVFNHTFQGYQGGYQCSIRAVTDWEHSGPPHGYEYVHDHPNYFSQYMNSKVERDTKIYVNYTGMQWPPVHAKTAPLEIYEQTEPYGVWNHYTYSNEGHRLDGIWEKTGNLWRKGTCVIEFNRTCERGGPVTDLRTGLRNAIVQDTDVSFRPRVVYDAFGAYGPGRFIAEETGECVDEVIRGCFNNGTCVAPDTCRCAPGWSGFDCSVPVCPVECKHNGKCVLPGLCHCEMGWSGADCSQPVCAQECMNGGRCVAPDTCQCATWEMEFFDSREVRRPLFRKPESLDPQVTGYTGFDCSVPICVQAEDFVLNIEDFRRNPNTEEFPAGFVYRGGRGYNNRELCGDVRCPQFSDMVLNNLGHTFQAGCGFDPLFGYQPQFADPEAEEVVSQGCCIKNLADTYSCRVCVGTEINEEMNVDRTFFRRNSTCDMEGTLVYLDATYPNMELTINDLAITTAVDACEALDPYCTVHDSVDSMPEHFTYIVNGKRKIRMCGSVDTFVDNKNVERQRPRNQYLESVGMRNKTSNNFLCGLTKWVQGDYIDDGDINTGGEANVHVTVPLTGLGIEYGPKGIVSKFPSGRHVRANYNNITKIGESGEKWEWGQVRPGEGVFVCPNGGSCVGPDICSCNDGYTGYDCREPLCRHLQKSGAVSGCENGGICASVDNCVCIQTLSKLYVKYPESNRGITGWMGADCSMPMCVQGFYDPFCTDLDQAPGGEGCFRCANGGNCTAPDVCTCAPGWTGYDCRTPICEVVADALLREQLNTVDEEKINLVEQDPCAMADWHGTEPYEGYDAYRGNCTRPNQCTCLCKDAYDSTRCEMLEEHCEGPWQDPLIQTRGLLDANQMFGSRKCRDGYEGMVDSVDRFMSCHMNIYVPEWYEAESVTFIVVSSSLAFVAIVGYGYFRQKIKKAFLDAKINRRKSRRSSEESITNK